jgi:hypothetical protein
MTIQRKKSLNFGAKKATYTSRNSLLLIIVGLTAIAAIAYVGFIVRSPYLSPNQPFIALGLIYIILSNDGSFNCTIYERGLRIGRFLSVRWINFEKIYGIELLSNRISKTALRLWLYKENHVDINFDSEDQRNTFIAQASSQFHLIEDRS